MPDKLLDPDHAWQRLADKLPPVGFPFATERLLRADALGRTLAGDIAATVDQPVADVSAMDGYACAGDLPLGVSLPVRGVAAAGPPPDFELAPGEIAKIMTGAVVPAGADRVLPIEATDGGARHVVLAEAPTVGAHIRRRGEVVETGGRLLGAGTRLGPAALSLIASHGHGEIEVVRRPTVAVLTTGDEVVPADQEPGPGQLRDSNSHFLVAACRGLGIDAEPLGIARDQRDDLRAKVSRGLEYDVLLLSGGVSKGDYDFVEDILDDHGCRRLVDAVAIQPGKPFVASHRGDAPDKGWAFGLPGNPAAVMVTFWLFVRPVLRRLVGIPDGFWRGAVRARLGGPLPRTKGRDRFFTATVRFDDGQLIATPLIPRGSHDTVRYGLGSALVRAPARQPETPAGAWCEILPVVDWPADV